MLIMRLLYIFLNLHLSIHLFGLSVSVHSYKFYANEKPYIDVKIRILAHSIKYKYLSDNNLESSADVTMYLEEEGTKNIVAWEKYKLQSPTLKTKKDIVDQRRFFVSPGSYTLKVSIVDSQDSLNKFGMQQKLKIVEKREPCFSDIELITAIEKRESGPMVRNGVYMEPFSFNTVNESQQVMHFYAELYHKEEGLISYGIYTGTEPSDSSAAVYIKYKKVISEEVSPLFFNFDLNKLVTGDYHLKVSLIDDSKHVITSKYAAFINKNFPADVAVKRDFNKEFSNSFVVPLDSSTVRYALRTLAPLLSNQRADALNLVLKEGTLNVQKYFLYKYYMQEYPSAPQQAYDTYMKVIKAVNEKFYNTVGEGFQSDRGYVYLKYGRPGKVLNIEDEANTPPYEIWYYDFVERTNQTNVRFIFYSPLLANEFDLLHSTCMGEKSNTQWEVVLYKNAPYEKQGTGFDATRMADNWNRKARKLFEDQ
jgi:GWxTD domain-containing protein